MQRLARVDVADTGDDPLIEEGSFDRRRLGAAGTGECRTVEFRRQRLRSQAAEHRVLLPFDWGQHVHEAKAARIVEEHTRARVEIEDDVIMPIHWQPHCSPPLDAKRARHAKMHQERLSGGQLHQEVLGAPGERSDSLAAQPAAKPRRERDPQIGTPHGDIRYAGTTQNGMQLAADGFYFGQLRAWLKPIRSATTRAAPTAHDVRVVEPGHFCAGLLVCPAKACAIFNAIAGVSAYEMFDVTDTTIPCSGNVMSDATVPPSDVPS